MADKISPPEIFKGFLVESSFPMVDVNVGV
jgi:hypothetical protein